MHTYDWQLVILTWLARVIPIMYKSVSFKNIVTIVVFMYLCDPRSVQYSTWNVCAISMKKKENSLEFLED